VKLLSGVYYTECQFPKFIQVCCKAGRRNTIKTLKNISTTTVSRIYYVLLPFWNIWSSFCDTCEKGWCNKRVQHKI